jgi:high-affinity nickel-transport protein
MRAGNFDEVELDHHLSQRGFMNRILGGVTKAVRKPRHMYPVGLLFGLGFDTATEVAVFGVSAAQAGKGVPLAAIMIFPALFAAGMSLIDTTDGVMMLGAYDWAFVKPMRKLYYNMTITLVSIAVAILIGGVEALGLIGDKLGFEGGFWDLIGGLNENFNMLGFAIIGVFAAAWLISYLVYRVKKLDEFEISTGGTA